MQYNKQLFLTISMILSVCHIDSYAATNDRFVVSRALKDSSLKTSTISIDKNKLAKDKVFDTKTSIELKKATVTCVAGQYLPGGKNVCKSCNSAGDRYYCPGGTFMLAASDQGLKSCPSGKVASSDYKKCVVFSSKSKEKVKCNSGQYLPAKTSMCKACSDNRYYCPGGSFTTMASSNQGLKSCPSGKVASSDYKKCVTSSSSTTKSSSNDVFVPKYVQCPAGQYLPAGFDVCKDCRADHACAGGKWKPDASNDQGIVKCLAGMIPNDKKSACVQEYIDCDAKYYLPAKKDACKACNAGKGEVCPGGSFKRSSKNQGIEVCSENQTANEDMTACVTVAAKCDPGYYLPGGASDCKLCPGPNNYCPGGKFAIGDVDQGKKECPTNFSVNTLKTGCTISYSKKSLQYGTNGDKIPLEEQCWTIKDAEEYQKCLMGDLEKYKL